MCKKFHWITMSKSENSQQFRKVLITIVRHGETAYNKEGILQGTVDTKLNSTGEMQALKVSNRLVSETTCNETNLKQPVRLIITSPLSRALVTAQTIQEQLQKAYKMQIPMIKTPLIQERHFGVYEGEKYEKLVTDLSKLGKSWESLEDPKLLSAANLLAELNTSKIEKHEQFLNRCKQAKKFILEQCFNHMKDNEEFHVVVVSHGLLTRGLLGELLYDEFMSCVLQNTAVCRISSNVIINQEKEVTLYKPNLLLLNDTSHL